MSQDLAAILTGEPSKAPAKKTAGAGAAPAKTYEPYEAAVRTVLAEESDPVAQDWVAGVIANRLKSGKHGKDFYEVVTAPGQFEPWKRGTAQSVDPNSKAYTEAAERVRDILEGKRDPSGGAMNFYAPEAQAELAKKDGRNPKAEFDDGTGVRVGKTLFFRPGGAKGGSDLASVLGAAEDAAAQAEAEKAFATTFGAAGAPDPVEAAGLTPYQGIKDDTLTKGQQELYEALNKGGGYKPEEPGGSPLNPFFMQKGVREKDIPPGAYYIDRSGKFQRQAGGDKEPESSVGRGFGQGAADVALSVANLFPGSDDSTIRNRLITDQAVYDADLKGDPISGAGRFGGQLAASVPLLMGGEAAAAPMLMRSGIGRFIAGAAGAEALPAGAGVAARAGQLALRGGSMAASGAAEGAGAAALTHSASDAPLQDQMLMGMALGGALKPLAAGAETGMRRFFGPSTKGAIPASEQQALAEAAGSLPVPMKLDAGQVSRAPAASAEVDNLLRGSDGDLAAGVVQRFRGEQQDALRGNVQAISDAIAGKEISPGAGAKAVSDTLNAQRDAAKKAINKAYDVAREHGDDAMLATGREVREGMLDGLRRKYNESKIGSVLQEVESLGAEGSPTVRQLYEARERLSGLTQSSDSVEAAAARTAKEGLDDYVRVALKNDLFIGDPKAVDAWREAIKKRAEFGKLFEADDLIEDLTTRGKGRGGALKVDPEEAVNYVLGVGNLGFATKRDLTRDLDRLRDVLGPKSEEWNGMRAEVFMRLARAGEGSPEAGAAQFSGQKFLKAWNELNEKNPRMVKGMFTDEERDLITKFADVAQAATTTVKGGANTSNSAIAAKRMLDKVGQFMSVGGGAGGGALVGGVPGAAMGAMFGSLLKDVREFLAVGKARKLTERALPARKDPGLDNKLLSGPPVAAAGAVTGNRILGERSEP